MVVLEELVVDEEKAVQLIEDLKKKLVRAQRQIAALREKSKYLEMQYDDARLRESNSTELLMELVERQHELNVMLNRAQTMLARTQEAMALTSLEFNEIAKALPEPKKAEFSDRISKINDLFKKTGIEEADLLTADKPAAERKEEEGAEDTLESEEPKSESARASRWESFWKRKQPRASGQPESDLVEDSGSQSTETAFSQL